MMKLSQASAYFDRTPVTDPDTGAFLFKGQIDPFDDSRRDSGAAYRRILSVRPGTAMPIGRAVRALGDTWLVGMKEPDGLESLHREKHLLMQASRKLNASHLHEYLNGTYSGQRWAEPVWVKDAKQLETSSASPQMHDVFLALDVPVHTVLWDAQEAFLVTSPRRLASGLVAAHALKLEHAPQAVALLRRTYNPTTGRYSTASPESVKCLKVRWQSLFEYDSPSDDRYQEGDVTVVAPLGANITTKDALEVSASETLQILATRNKTNVTLLHCRRL